MNKMNKIVSIAISCISIITTMVIILLSMRGKSEIKNATPDTIHDQTLSCSSASLKYPYYNYDNSSKRIIDITMIFDKTSIKTVSLKYSLYYDDVQEVLKSEALNHAAMNKEFGKDNMGPDALSASYSRQSDKLTMSIMTSNIDDINKKYFLLENINVPNRTIGYYEKYYVDNNFNCKIIE